MDDIKLQHVNINNEQAAQLVSAYNLLYSKYNQVVKMRKLNKQLPVPDIAATPLKYIRNDVKITNNIPTGKGLQVPSSIQSIIGSYLRLDEMLRVFPLISRCWFDSAINYCNHQWTYGTLQLYVYPTDPCFPRYFNYLKQLRHIHYFIVSYRSLDSYLNNLSALPKLESLKLTHNTQLQHSKNEGINDEHIKTLINACNKGNIKLNKLTILISNNNKLTIETINNVLLGLPHLLSLNILAWNSIDINKAYECLANNYKLNNNLLLQSFQCNRNTHLHLDGINHILQCTNLRKLLINEKLFFQHINQINNLSLLNELILCANFKRTFDTHIFILLCPQLIHLTKLTLYIPLTTTTQNINKNLRKNQYITNDQWLQLLNKFPNLTHIKLGNSVYLSDTSLFILFNKYKPNLVYFKWRLLTLLHNEINRINILYNKKNKKLQKSLINFNCIGLFNKTRNNYFNISKKLLNYGITYSTGLLWYTNHPQYNAIVNNTNNNNNDKNIDFSCLNQFYLTQFMNEFIDYYNTNKNNYDDNNINIKDVVIDNETRWDSISDEDIHCKYVNAAAY